MRAAGASLRLIPAAGLILAALASPAAAIDAAQVERFLGMSEMFHARLPNSPVEDLSAEARRERARCMLESFENRFGAEGVQALMELMAVLANGAEFDDPTIIGFNERYGPVYDSQQRACTRQATRS